MLKINNRRYVGSKFKLISHIEQAIESNLDVENFSFADLFSGTGAVAYHFAQKNHCVFVNDILYSNVIAYKAWFSNGAINKLKIEKQLDFFNSLNYNELTENYFSDIYGGKYFSINDAKKIGFIRDYIEEHKSDFSGREYFVLLTSLVYATDKIANTVGHFEHFLRKEPQDSNFVLENLDIEPVGNTKIFNEDANNLAKRIDADVVYLDPPYNARQYVNFYHVLENLARWNKPTEFEGSSMKFKRNELKSGYSQAKAPKLFADLVNSLNCKLIVVSYNNTYTARSIASNNKIQEQEILEILQAKGEVSKTEIDYKSFNAGKTNFQNHKEFIFTCKVRENRQ